MALFRMRSSRRTVSIREINILLPGLRGRYERAKMTEKDKRKIYHLRRHGWTDGMIAEKMHYSRATIGQTRRELGIRAKRDRPRTITPMQVASIMEMRRQGLGYKKISNRMQIGTSTVHSIVKREERRHGKISAA